MIGHQGEVRNVTEIRTTGTIVTSSTDKTVKVWRSEDGLCLNTLSLCGSSLAKVTVVDDVTVLIAYGKCVQVRELLHGRILATSNDFCHKIVSCSAISPNTALICDTHRTIMKIMWSGGSIQVVAEKKLNFEITRIDVLENLFITCLTNSCAVLWDLHSFSAIRTFSGHKSMLSSVTCDESYFITASHDETIRVHDIHTAAHLRTIRTHKGWVRSVKKVVDTNMIISGGDDKIIALHEIPSGYCIAKFNIGMSIESIAILSNGTLAVAGARPNEIKIFRIDLLPIPNRRRSTGQSQALTLALKEAASWHEAYERLEERVSSALDRIAKLERASNKVPFDHEEVCCVDLEPFSPRDKVFRLPCGHVHHVECLLPFLRRQAKPECPICRTPVPKEELSQIHIWDWSHVLELSPDL